MSQQEEHGDDKGATVQVLRGGSKVDVDPFCSFCNDELVKSTFTAMGSLCRRVLLALSSAQSRTLYLVLEDSTASSRLLELLELLSDLKAHKLIINYRQRQRLLH